MAGLRGLLVAACTCVAGASVPTPPTTGGVPIHIDWPTLLAQHDPIWKVGMSANPVAVCANISVYDTFVGYCGGNSTRQGTLSGIHNAPSAPPPPPHGSCRAVGVGTCDESASIDCMTQFAVACDKDAKCASFATDPAWRQDVAQLSDTPNVTDATPNADWTM